MNAAPSDLSALEEYVSAAQQKTALVIGDVMLDRYIYGAVNRISPESDAPVLDIVRETLRVGGAGNVAANLRALGMTVHLLGITGDDDTSGLLRHRLEDLGIVPGNLISVPGRPTTLKTRFATFGRQLLRADWESRDDLPAAAAQSLISRLGELIGSASIIVLSDYNKGVLTPAVIDQVMALAAKAGVPVLVDPKKNDARLYKGAFLITPNRKELAAMTGLPCESESDIDTAAQNLLRQGGFARLVVTRSEDGMSVYETGAAPVHIPAENDTICDVSGAGDTVIAWLAAALAGGARLPDAARLASRAAALAVREQGTVSVAADDLRGALKDLPPYQAASAFDANLVGWDDAAAQIASWKKQGLRVGFTNGCFDILHYGHVSYLNRARERCDRLVVGLNHDRSVKLLKGPERPLHDENARAAVIGALAAVDMVVLFGAEQQGEDNTPCALLQRIAPDVFFKGGDYTLDRLPEAAIMKALGGTVDLMPLYEGHSTTATINKMKKTEAA